MRSEKNKKIRSFRFSVLAFRSFHLFQAIQVVLIASKKKIKKGRSPLNNWCASPIYGENAYYLCFTEQNWKVNKNYDGGKINKPKSSKTTT